MKRMLLEAPSLKVLFFFAKLVFISYSLFFSYCVNPGLVPTGLGWHIVPGLGCLGTILAGAFWLPWLT